MIEKLAQFTDIRACLVVGGLSIKVRCSATAIFEAPGGGFNALLSLPGPSFMPANQAAGATSESQTVQHCCSESQHAAGARFAVAGGVLTL